MCDHDEVATAEVAGWSLVACEPTTDSGSWLVEVSPPGGSFVDLHFDIEGPQIFEKILRFIHETRGRRQYGGTHELADRRQIQAFDDPSITIGQWFEIDVELFKNGAEEDHYFVVIAGPNRNVLRLRIWGADVNNVIAALETLKEQLSDRRQQ